MYCMLYQISPQGVVQENTDKAMAEAAVKAAKQDWPVVRFGTLGCELRRFPWSTAGMKKLYHAAPKRRIWKHQ